MSIKRIPVATNASNQIQVTSLDGTDYILRLLWNARVERWFMTVRDASNNDLITGRKLCADIPWGAHETIDGHPAGQLWVLRPDGTGVDPGLRELNVDAFIMYVEEDSVT